jgi:hypothetical protein
MAIVYETERGAVNELYHYGVIGMKWGVRRASRQLSKATTKEQRDKAIGKLNKHRSKASAEIAKRKAKRPKLQERADKLFVKNDVRASNLKKRAGVYRRRASRVISTQFWRNWNHNKSERLYGRADKLRESSRAAKEMVERNETYIRMFSQGIDTIDATLINRGKRVMTA